MWGSGKIKLLSSINQFYFGLYPARRIVYSALFVVVMSVLVLSGNTGNSISGSSSLFGMQPVVAQSVDVETFGKKYISSYRTYPRKTTIPGLKAVALPKITP